MTAPTPADTVRAFYEAVKAKDGSAVAAVVEARFHDESSMTRPESVPHGGTVSGRARLQRLLAGAAGADVGPEGLEIVGLAAGQTEVAVELRFAWRSSSAAAVDTGAVEWWSFDEDGLVRSIRVYYADTAHLAPSDPQHIR